ncbi:YheV family putative zinc ribbon protein [Alkanindiges sp. WGS2144]|uniref:YheV family putative zinc ribbon protein n=1 Tax=Alkanindiges sp. WGS2144 TaxID=3366808 RepID=UPI0037523556
MTIKKRFIAGAKCTQCGAMDRVMQLTTTDDEWIECVDCGYTERRPTAINPPASAVTNSPSKADEVGVVQFKPLG